MAALSSIIHGAAAASEPGTAPLPFQATTLKNGLKVITLEDHHAPVVTVELCYFVGSKDENPGRYGFAHLFEHMMFKGSQHVADEAHDHYVEQTGGEAMADTSFDRTRFYETIPINALDRVLYLEADRMASLRVDQNTLDAERHVVEEEYRQRITNAPYGIVNEKLLEMIYPAGHPYAHDAIGSIADLDAAKVGEVREFHDTYYKPDNACLVLVGDFKTLDALNRVRKYFGGIAARGKPFPRHPDPAIVSTPGSKITVTAPLAPVPVVTLAFPVAQSSNVDASALYLLATLLSAGRNSRFFHSIVGGPYLSGRPTASIASRALGGYFSVEADVVAGHTPLEVETAIDSQLERLRNEPVGADELAKAKNLQLTALVQNSVATDDVAQSLGDTVVLFGNADAVNQLYRNISAVTAADLQRVAKHYLAAEKARILYAMPPPPAEGAKQ